MQNDLPLSGFCIFNFTRIYLSALWLCSTVRCMHVKKDHAVGKKRISPVCSLLRFSCIILSDLKTTPTKVSRQSKVTEFEAVPSG